VGISGHLPSAASFLTTLPECNPWCGQ